MNKDFGDWNTMGDWNTLGNFFHHGKRLKMEGVKVLALMCLSNVDGTGRQIIVIVHTDGIKIRAGCFAGTLEEFCDKATAENKTRYARVVRAAAEALRQDVIKRHYRRLGRSAGINKQSASKGRQVGKWRYE